MITLEYIINVVGKENKTPTEIVNVISFFSRELRD